MVEATLYKAEWCEPCHKVLAHLDSRGVAVHQLDIDKDEGAAKEVVDIPVTVFWSTDEIVKGYDRAALDAAIGRAGGGRLSGIRLAGAAIGLAGIAVGIYIMVKS